MLWSAMRRVARTETHTHKKNKTPGRRCLCFILYRFISSSMCAYRQFTRLTATQATSHSVCVRPSRGSTHCPAGTQQVTPYLYSSLIAFSPPHSSRVKCRKEKKKNRYPLINSKAVKILSSSKGCESPIRSQSLPSWSQRLEPSGKKVFVCSIENVPSWRRTRVSREITQCRCFIKNHGHVMYTHTHTTRWTLLIIIWYGADIVREPNINTEI